MKFGWGAALWMCAMHTSLILYAEQEFNASTFAGRVIAGTGSDVFSCITGAVGALRGPKYGGANEAAFGIQNRYDNPDEAEVDIRRRLDSKEAVMGLVIAGAIHNLYSGQSPFSCTSARRFQLAVS
jgi:2-methylcitrate synthase